MYCDACPETSSASPWKQRGSTCTPLARAGRTHLNLITRQLYKTPKGALGREMNPVKHHLPFSPSPSRKQRLAGQPEAPAPHGHGHRTLDTHSLGALERSGSWSTKTQHLNSTARHWLLTINTPFGAFIALILSCDSSHPWHWWRMRA